MSTFQEFLYQKRAALLARREEQERNPPEGPNVLKAHVEAAGRSGVRRIQIRQFEILSDSGRSSQATALALVLQRFSSVCLAVA